MIDAQKQMDKKIEDLESEVVALRRRRTVDAGTVPHTLGHACSRAYVGDMLHTSVICTASDCAYVCAIRCVSSFPPFALPTIHHAPFWNLFSLLPPILLSLSRTLSLALSRTLALPLVAADEISELETRALVAEQSLISIQNNFQMVSTGIWGFGSGKMAQAFLFKRFLPTALACFGFGCQRGYGSSVWPVSLPEVLWARLTLLLRPSAQPSSRPFPLPPYLPSSLLLPIGVPRCRRKRSWN